MSEEEALKAEVARLEAELEERERTRLASHGVLRERVAETREAVASLERSVSELESELMETQRLRDEAVDAAKRATSHVEELKRSGASRGQPRNYWWE